MRKLTQNDFLERSYKSHGDVYDYSKSIYVNRRSKVIIICIVHGDFEMLPYNHTDNKQGCVKCVLDKHKLTTLKSERVENLRKVHNNKYTYNDLSVTKGFINITCPEHGIFRQYLYFHEYGHGCSECNSSSKGEDRIKNYLINNNISFNRDYQFVDCVRIRRMRFDFYLPGYNICIEFDGEHHYLENNYFGVGNLEYVKINDGIKNKYCLDNNIKIFRIPYWDYKNIENILSNLLQTMH